MRLTRNYVTGLIFIVLVALMWTASSVSIQFIFDSGDNNFHSPFLVVYIGVSLFTLWIPTQKLIACLLHSEKVHPTQQSRTVSDSRVPYQTVPFQQSTCNEEHEEEHHSEAVVSPPQTSLSLQNDGLHQTGVNTGEEDLQNNDIGFATGTVPWTETDHLRTAAYIAPVWFLANWTYTASLAYTSITSSTVLASTGSLFTFLFAVIAADEQFNCTKLAGVLLGVGGSILTALHDSTPAADSSSVTFILDERFLPSECYEGNCPVERPLLGDFLGLISAVGYGTYAVQTRVLCPKDESLYSMQTLLGYIGLLNLVVLSPITIYLLLSGRTELAWVILGFLVVKGFFDNFLSDYLWLRAVMLTNATTATVGLGLTIPLAFASDAALGKNAVLTAEQVVGALSVLAGFVLVNLGNQDDEQAVAAGTHRSGSTTRIEHHPPFGDESQRGQEVVDLHDKTIT